jgi:hypothetical protein
MSGRIARPAPEREIVDTQDTRRRDGRDAQHLDQTKQRVWTGRHTRLSSQSRPTLATRSQAEFSQQAPSLVSAARTTREKTLKPLGEDAPSTT